MNTLPEIHDIKPLESLPYLIPWTAIAIATLVVAALAMAFWLWRKRQKQPRAVQPPPAPKPQKPAADLALEALRTLLETSNDQAALRRCHFRISEILRIYVEAECGINATDLTTPELMRQLRQHLRPTPDERQNLRVLLDTTDKVKFAGIEAEHDATLAVCQQAIAWVEAYRPHAETPSEPAERSA